MASPGAGACGAWSLSSSTAAAAAEEEEQRRRLKRRASNRESARRTRARKQQQVDDLEAEAAALRGGKAGLEHAVRAAARGRAAVEAENAALRGRARELAARLRSLAGLLRCMESSSSSSCTGGLQHTMPQQQPATIVAASQPDTMYCSYYY
ncbi:hypothetical protein ACP70R_040615 [Stipagrostis hirtigluma subsp. patula]